MFCIPRGYVYTDCGKFLSFQQHFCSKKRIRLGKIYINQKKKTFVRKAVNHYTRGMTEENDASRLARPIKYKVEATPECIFVSYIRNKSVLCVCVRA